MRMCFGFAALQLHPDKNPHPKAEFAFKLVSQVRFDSFSEMFFVILPFFFFCNGFWITVRLFVCFAFNFFNHELLVIFDEL